MQVYTPVYHKKQYLLVPVTLNKKDRRLFILDTGIRLTAMKSEVAHSVSKTRVNFTNSVQTVSGSSLHLYRDSFDFQFANLSIDNQSHILEFDPSTTVETERWKLKSAACLASTSYIRSPCTSTIEMG